MASGMSKRANRLLFGTLVAFVAVSGATLLFVMPSDFRDQVSPPMITALVSGAILALVERLSGGSSWLPGPSHRDPSDPNGHLYKWYGNGR
jgi:hypothetical protein